MKQLHFSFIRKHFQGIQKLKYSTNNLQQEFEHIN